MEHLPFPHRQSQQICPRANSDILSWKPELATHIPASISSTTGNEHTAGPVTIAMSLQPASTFTQFPRLPLELRQIIWRACLPPSNRVLPVKIIDAADSHSSKFKSCCSHSAYADASDLRMLEVSHESRTEYLAANPKFLPGVRRAKLYFKPEATIIYLTNFGNPFTVVRLSDVMDIRILAVFCPTKSGVGDPGRVYAFGNLKELMCVVGGTPTGFEHRRYCKEVCTNTMRELERYNAKVKSSNNIPKVSILEGMP